MLIILCSLILFVDCPDFNRHLLCLLVPRVGLEPTRPHRAIDFESIVSTNSTTWANKISETSGTIYSLRNPLPPLV